VTFKGKFIKTKGYVEEKAAGKAIYRGAFSPANVTGDLFYNPFNL
jgi:carotenoid cleavage dioxygenase-like enzyme